LKISDRRFAVAQQTSNRHSDKIKRFLYKMLEQIADCRLKKADLR